MGGGRPLVCSHHMLDLMFNEPHLLLVFRVALEIEMVYSIPNEEGENEDPDGFLNFMEFHDEQMTVEPDAQDPLQNQDTHDQTLEGKQKKTPLNLLYNI